MGVGASLRVSRDRGVARADALDWVFIRRSTAWLVPLGFLGVTVFVVMKYMNTPSWLGVDASLYAAASAAWLGGADPWAVSEAGFFYAAPPPTLLAFLPFAWMPPLAPIAYRWANHQRPLTQ